MRCSDLGMRPRGPSVAGWIRGARAPLYSMVRICHEARQGASVINQGSVSGGLARFQHAAGWCWVPACAGVTFGYLASSRPDFCFYGHCRTNPGAGLVRDGGWLGTCVVVWLLWLETFSRFHSMQDPKIGGVPSRGRGEGEDDCEVSFGMLVVSQSRHRRLEPASFDKLRFSGHLWATALCNRILPVAGPFDCRFILLSSACHSEGSEEPQPCQGDPLLRSG